MNKNNGSQYIGAHHKQRPSNEFEEMFNSLQEESYEAEIERKRAEKRQREAGSNKYGFADLSNTAKDND